MVSRLSNGKNTSSQDLKIPGNLPPVSSVQTDHTEMSVNHAKLERAASHVLSNKGLDVLKAVNAYYEHTRENPLEQQTLTTQLTAYLRDLPFLEGVVSAGQIACGGYDPYLRRVWAFNQLAEGKIDEFTFLRRDLPDIDFISIVDPQQVNGLRFSKDIDEHNRRCCSDALHSWPGWNSWSRMIADKYPVASVKNTSAVEERHSLIDQFLSEGRLALCLCNPVAQPLWNNQHYLVEPQDYRYVNSLRDLAIGIDTVAGFSPEVQTDIPAMFQTNFLLNAVSKHGAESVTDLLFQAFSMARDSMPERPPHAEAPELVSYSSAFWKKTVERAAKEDLIEIRTDSSLALTESGEKAHKKLLQNRTDFLRSAQSWTN